jgi:hypothetical protein
MTANAGKGADEQPGQRSTSTDAKGGQPRKKTSAAAKPPSDEVTLSTNGEVTNGSEPPEVREEDTVVDGRTDFTDDTVQDIEVPGKKFGKPAESSEETGDESADNSVDRSVPNGSMDGEVTTNDTGAWRPALPAPADDADKSLESVESAPSPGRSPAMDVPTGPGPGSGSGPGPGSGAGSGSGPGPGPGPGPGFGGSMPPAGGRPRPPRQAAILEQAAKVSKLTGALRRPDAKPGRKAPRKAHLQVARLEPWSVMKFSFVMSLVCFIVLFVAVVVLYMILSWLGVFDALSNTIRDLTSNEQGKSGGINPASWFSAARILSYTALIGTLNVLLITALATVWSVIYNMAADLVGGVEVTLKEADQ